MITQLQIENQVEGKSGVCLEVFSSVVDTKSKATRRSAVLTAEAYCLKVLESLPGSAPVTKTSSIETACRSLDLESLLCLASDADIDMQKRGLVKLIMSNSFTRNLGIRLVAFVYDLDYSRLKNLRSGDRDLYYEVGDAIFLAGLYLALQEG